VSRTLKADRRAPVLISCLNGTELGALMPCVVRADPCFTAARVPGRETVFVTGDSGEFVRATQLREGELRRVQRDCFVRAARRGRRPCDSIAL
jgi:hypothetical protein